MGTTDLSNKTCVPCEGGVPALAASDAKALMSQLDSGWELDMSGGGALKRRLTFKGFAKAVYTANLAAFLADREGHHPDISFGWGYCDILYTTHDIGGLSENDFICAAKFDRLLAAA
ncbi:MAG TPA: 4a-hydroxytetrahydrobiopterin dehydratase [Aliiroseovarius sp.]|nr:4a-hydroxytetrahydrobiopterin dehydratase [Aliiroseovarius sp.]